MSDMDLQARELNDFSDLLPRARRHVRNLLLVSLVALAALCVSIVAQQGVPTQLEAAAPHWTPAAVDYE